MSYLETSVKPSERSQLLEDIVSHDRFNISKFFDVDGEVHKVNELRNRGLSEGEVDFFIKEQAMRFLLEFAGEVSYTTIHQTFNKGVLRSAGLDVLEHYNQAKYMGEDSRGFNEFVGIQRVVDALRQDNSTAVILSPPWIGDYSFAFVFEKQGKVVREHIVRYTEEKGDLSTSAQISKNLEALGLRGLGVYQSTNDFVSTPFLGDVPAELVLESLGLDYEEITRSKKIEQLYEQRLQPILDKYLFYIKNEDVSRALFELHLAYSLAQTIRKDMELDSNLTTGRYKLTNSQELNLDTVVPITEGSCPVLSRSVDDTSITSPSTSLSHMAGGMEFSGGVVTAQESSDDTTTVVCPKCGAVVAVSRSDVRKTHVVQCPHCHYQVSGCDADSIASVKH